jgi:hypothetical protein
MREEAVSNCTYPEVVLLAVAMDQEENEVIQWSLVEVDMVRGVYAE